MVSSKNRPSDVGSAPPWMVVLWGPDADRRPDADGLPVYDEELSHGGGRVIARVWVDEEYIETIFDARLVADPPNSISWDEASSPS